MNIVTTALLIWVAAVDLPVGTELEYAGSLTQQSKSGAGEVKSFAVYLVSSANDQGNTQWAFHLEERGGGGWAWPERFGLLPLADGTTTKSNRIRLLYTHESQQYPLPIRSPIFEFRDKLVPQASWTDGKYEYQVTRPRKIMNRECLQIEVSSNLGRMQTLVVETATGILMSLDERIILGRGDEFQLKMELKSQTQLGDGDLAKSRPPLDSLLAIQAGLNRTGEQKVIELTADQLASLREKLPQVEKEAEGTTWSRVVAAISRDLQSQQKRLAGIDGLQKKLVGQPAPKFSLKLADGATISDDSLADKVVVLHFWQYRSEPLQEPYGQIGYLDFLNTKRKKLGVTVLGVNVDERFANPQQAKVAVRSMKSLLEFMRVSYDVAIDDGSTLSEFGDPRSSGAPLPLWIVIGHDGKVVHHHTGFYNIKPDEGLKQLDDAVVEALRRQKAK